MVVTDCDYCGEMTICFEDEAGGTCCHSCDREDDLGEWKDSYNKGYISDDDGQPEILVWIIRSSGC